MELQHSIVSIFLKIYFTDILFSRAHILRTLFIFWLDKVLNFLVLMYGFLLYVVLFLL